MGKGGVALDVGFKNSSSKTTGSLPKGLAQRLSERAKKSAEKAKAAREQQNVKRTQPQKTASTKSSSKTEGRGTMRVNPVTGKMTRVESRNDSGEEMVREGCMLIPKKYLTAATDAGLGSSNGMYSHMSAVRRELNSGHNLGARQGSSSRTSTKTASGPTTTMVSTGGASRIHKLNTTSSSAPSRRNNIKHVVQGRSRSITNSSRHEVHESSFGRQKGVVNTFGGAKCIKRPGDDGNSARKTGIATLGSSNGRSFIKHQKPAKAASKPQPTSNQEKQGGQQKNTTTIVRTLGGKATASSSMSDRERRAAFFAKKFGK